MRAHLAGMAGVSALLLPLAACSGTDSQPGSQPDAASTSASADTTSDATWNPCGDLSPGRIGRALGADVTRETGTDDTPRCAFLPVAKGGPTLNVTYVWYSGGFEKAWSGMGKIDGRVTDLDIAGADHARLVVNAGRKAVLVTAFLQTGDLIETVNAIGLKPYDRAAMVAATTGVLTELASHAPASEKAAGEQAAAANG